MKPRTSILTAACTAVLLSSAALPAEVLAQRAAAGGHVRIAPAAAHRVAAGGRVSGGSVSVASSAQRVAVAGGVRVAPRSAVVVGGGYHYGPHPYYPRAYYGGYPWYPTYGFGISFGFGYGYPYAYPYGYYGYPGYAWGGPYPYYYDGSASLRLQVSPRDTQVFVDGYYAGVVDSFDGTFQRLNIEPGEHEVQLYLPGHKTVVTQLYLQPGKTTSIKRAMDPLAPGEAEPAKPTPEPSVRPSQPRQSQSPYSPSSRRPAPAPRDTRDTDVTVSELPPDPDLAGYGTVALKVQPGPASITIDGEKWEGPAAVDEALIVQLTAGKHVVSIQKDGFRQYTTEVNVRPGRTSTLNVALTKN